MPLEQLQSYRPALTRQPDFEAFWDEAKRELAEQPAQVALQPAEYPLDGVKMYELTYRGLGGALIRGWYAVPDRPGPHPGLVCYHGYNHSMEGAIHDIANWAAHGYAAFGMQVRGQQGSEDNSVSPHGHYAGWMTKGILDPRTYYYRGVYMDAIRALEVLASRPEVDPSRIGVTGGSQGGALSLAAAALSDIPAVCAADYPYLAHFRRAIDVAPAGPYLEINEFFRRNGDPSVEERAMLTLSYYDVMNLAPWIRCPVQVSIGLIDAITPPSTVFAAYNHLTAPNRRILVYRYFGHEYIPRAHTEKLRFLRQYLKRPGQDSVSAPST
ncbi:MAG: acetylxylan esterase [Alicyclobacillus sp.]|nr:acetylxylan esterase [Alicyclobacillus sp.]